VQWLTVYVALESAQFQTLTHNTRVARANIHSNWFLSSYYAGSRFRKLLPSSSWQCYWFVRV